MTEKGSRRAKESSPAISPILGAPSLVGAGLLEHGLDHGDNLYVWANKTSAQDLSSKLRAGFQLVKMDEVKTALEENGLPVGFYAEDAQGNVTYGIDLILMRGSKKRNEAAVQAAFADQEYLVTDATESEIRDQIDTILYSTPLGKGQRVAISKDADHATTQEVTLKESK